MTIAASTRRAGPFTGTGQAVDYPFAFKVFAQSHVQPYQADADGNERRLQYNTDYSVTLNPNQETHPGGVLRLTAALPAGHKLTIISEMPISQPTEFTNQGGFYPRTLNDSLDRLTIYVQQLAEALGRSISTGVNAEDVPVIPSPSAGRFLHWDGQGKMANIELATLMSDDATGEDSKIASIAALKQVAQALDNVRQAYEGAIQNTNQDVDELENSIAELRRIIEATNGSVPPALLQRLEAAESVAAGAQSAASAASAAANSARQTALAAQTTAGRAETTANAALPKSGGTLTGHVATRYDHEWVGMGFDNTHPRPVGTYIDAFRNGVMQANQQIYFHEDGATSFTLRLTPPGDKSRDRREDALRVNLQRIWHKVYGNLHEFFLNNNDIHHEWFPSHYNGTEVWWHKRMRMKICQMRIDSQSSLYQGTNDLSLPTRFDGMTTVFGHHYNLINNYGTPITAHLHNPTTLRTSGWGSTSYRTIAHFLIVGWADK